jgi:hypothetical protein
MGLGRGSARASDFKGHFQPDVAGAKPTVGSRARRRVRGKINTGVVMFYTAKQHEERKGLYWEAIEMFVDGLIEDIKTGHITSKHQADSQLEQEIGLESYVIDNDLAIETLWYSNYPTMELFQHGVQSRGPQKSNGKPSYWNHGEMTFPFCEFAHAAFSADAYIVLSLREEYQQLPATDPVEENAIDQEDNETK